MAAAAAASSSPPPPWVILGSIAAFSDDDSPPGFDHGLSFFPPPTVSLLTVPSRLFPERLSNPVVLAVDPSGSLLLLHAVIRPATDKDLKTVDLPGLLRTLARRSFVNSYFVLVQPTRSVIELPEPWFIKNPCNVGVLYSSSAKGRFIVGELQSQGNTAMLLCYQSNLGHWNWKHIRSRIPLNFVSNRVLSHDNKLWWVDLHCGLIVCDPFVSLLDVAVIKFPVPELSLLQDEKIKGRESIEKCRLVSVSAGKLCFVNMYRDNVDQDRFLKVSVWTLSERDSKWKLECEARFCDIWSHQGYEKMGLPKTIPALALLHPKDPQILYFFLGNHLLSVNLRTCDVVDKDIYQLVAPSRNHVSSHSVHELKITYMERRESMKPGIQNNINWKCIEKNFTLSYDQWIDTRNDPYLNNNAFFGSNGQTRACASQALNHWNLLQNIPLAAPDASVTVAGPVGGMAPLAGTPHGPKIPYTLDTTEHMDSNGFNLMEDRRFGIQHCCFHVNFYATIPGGKSELFFAELRGIDGPEAVTNVTSLGHNEDEERIHDCTVRHQQAGLPGDLMEDCDSSSFVSTLQRSSNHGDVVLKKKKSHRLVIFSLRETCSHCTGISGISVADVLVYIDFLFLSREDKSLWFLSLPIWRKLISLANNTTCREFLWIP
ncbi:hypothetical protein EJB05_16205, partial [Eragrostis curvula]